MNMNYIREIAEALSENHAALMVGAGFSKNAEKVSITDKKFLNWNELSDLFYETVYQLLILLRQNVNYFLNVILLLLIYKNYGQTKILVID